jgi:hypothetical protein
MVSGFAGCDAKRFAPAYATLGDADQAFRFLEEALRARDLNVLLCSAH